MKNLIMSVIACCFAGLAMSFVINPSVNAKECPNCGGKLEWVATAIKTYETCVLCKGSGVVEIGKEKKTCTLCKGKGQTVKYEPGYVCKKCHSVYRQ